MSKVVNGNKWGSVLTCPKLQNDRFENLYISSHEEARNIEFGQQINITERVPLGTPQVVVMSLAQNHVTNLFISSYRGCCYQIWAVTPTM